MKLYKKIFVIALVVFFIVLYTNDLITKAVDFNNSVLNKKISENENINNFVGQVVTNEDEVFNSKEIDKFSDENEENEEKNIENESKINGIFENEIVGTNKNIDNNEDKKIDLETVIEDFENEQNEEYIINKRNNLVVTENTSSKSIDEGIYEIQTENFKVLEVINSSIISGGNVQINKVYNSKNQKVEIKYTGNGYYTIKFLHSGMFLDVANAETKNGTNVWQCRENGSDAQKWIIKDIGDGYYNIISKCSNTYLTIANGSLVDGTNVEINTKKRDNSQTFKFKKVVNKTGTKTISEGIYEIEVENGKVVEVVKDSNISGGNVQLNENNNARSQKVEVKYTGNGYYTIKFLHSGMLLDVANAETKNSTNVWQCRENWSDAQKWIIKDVGDGYYNIISKCSNTYLTVSGENIDNCANIEINSYKNNNLQKFKFNKMKEVTGTQTIKDGTYEIETALHPNKVVEVINASTISGGNVQLNGNNNARGQKVEVKYTGNGYYTIKFLHSGMFLDVANAETKNGTNVWQCRENGADAQKWIIKDVGNGYYNIISKCSNTYLTVSGQDSANCTNIEINSNQNSDSQKFKFNKVTQIIGKKIIDDGIYEIETGVSNNKVIDVINATTVSGGNVQIFSRNNAKCQKVTVKYVGDGYYTMKFEHSGLYLDVANGETADGTNVWQCRKNESDAQKWIIQEAGDGYYNIISKCSETYLTVTNGSCLDGANIEINSLKNNLSQKFKFNKIENLIGIDVSAHNGKINWDRVKKQGIDFAIIRCGYGQDLTNQDDAMFARNVSECERLEIPYGIYIYSYALDENAASSEADHVLRLIKGCNPRLGIWFDMEDADGYKSRNGMPSNETLVNICITFCEKIKSQGYNVGIYASLSWLKNQLNDNRLDVYDKWVAQWNITCTYTKRYVMWQYTNSGTVDGIEGYVDMNKYYM